MNEQDIAQSTKQLIDALKQSCGAVGLGNDGNEVKRRVAVRKGRVQERRRNRLLGAYPNNERTRR